MNSKANSQSSQLNEFLLKSPQTPTSPHPSNNTNTIKKKSFIKRTFGPIIKGSLRGNIFLLIIISCSCVFFYLPYLAKRSGIAFTSLCILFCAFISHLSSRFLYQGFKATRGQNYNQVVK